MAITQFTLFLLLACLRLSGGGGCPSSDQDTHVLLQSKAAIASGTSLMDDQVVSNINARFRNGQPSNKIHNAGVVVHAFDQSAGAPPWSKIPPWLSLNPPDRVCASIINSRLPYTFRPPGQIGMPKTPRWVGSAGFVISPQAATLSLRCSFARDAGSAAMDQCKSGQCVPGCIGTWRSDPTVALTRGVHRNQWCSANTTEEAHGGTGPPCAWHPTDVAAMMNYQESQVAGFLKARNMRDIRALECTLDSKHSSPLYNEIILDSVELSKNLPNAIEAIYFLTDTAACSPDHARAGEEVAKAAQELFFKMYQLHIPLMRVTSFSVQMPFERVPPPKPAVEGSLHSDNHVRQVGVFAFVMISVVCTVPLLLFVFCFEDRPQTCCLLLAVLSCIYFGIENFIIANSALYLQQPSTHMAMAFFFEAALAFLMHVLLRQCSPSYKSAWQATVSSAWRNLACVAFAGISIGLAQCCANVGFAIDPASSGPHQALVCLDVLIVGPFFSWHSGERITKVQLAALILMIAGAFVLSDTGHWYNNPVSFGAFLWLTLSMLFYAASIICWRLASVGKDAIPWQPRLLLIYGTIGIVGVLPVLTDLRAGLIGIEEFIDAPQLSAWPLLNAIVAILGMWSVNLAFQKPVVSTCVITAIVDSSSVVLLLMSMAASHLMPSITKITGMCTILFAGMCMCCAELVQG